MKQRVAILAGVLLVRAAVGGWVTQGCRNGQRVRLAGKVGQIYQKETKSVLKIGEYWVETGKEERYFRGQSVAVIGRCQRRVIDFFLNKIWLTEPKITIGAEKVFANGDEVGWVAGMRGKLAAVFQRSLPEPEASLAAGIVLGNQVRFEEEFYQALIKTGTVHLVVVSGYNLTVVGEFVFYWLILRWPRRRVSIVVSGAMLAYAALSGLGMPALRAWLMGSLLLVARAGGKTQEASWWLVVTVWLMLMVDVGLVENISFQLSVAATSGLIFIEPRLRPVFSSKYQVLSMLAKTELIPTLSAQITTAPLIWWHFGRVSLISPPVNVLVLPLVPPAMLLGVLLLGVGGMSGGLLSWLVAPLLYALLHLMVLIIKLAA